MDKHTSESAQIYIFGKYFTGSLTLQDKQWEWQNGHPLAYQDWSMPHHNGSSSFLIKHHAASRQYDEQVVSYDHRFDLFHLNTFKCAAVRFAEPSVSYWVTIPCHRKVFTRVLCAGDTKKGTNSEIIASLNQDFHGCPQSYFKWSEFCYSVYIRDPQAIIKQPSDFSKKSVRRTITEDLLTYFGRYLAHVFRYRENPETEYSCVKIQTYVSLRAGIGGYVLSDDSLCEDAAVEVTRTYPSVFINASCDTQTFTCSNGECLADIFVCDGDKDCQDGSDETQCSSKCRQHTQISGRGIEKVDCDKCHLDNCTCTETYFQCWTGGCIFMFNVCDHIPHCSDESDEAICNHLECNNSTQFHCGSGLCIDIDTVCDLVNDCPDGIDELNCTEQCNGYKCNSGECIFGHMVDDLIPDCPGVFPDDETELLTPYNNSLKCSYHELPCLTYHSHCYSLERFCVYDKDSHGHLYPCRNGGHLRYCKHVDCPGRFKCPNSYCLPTHRVCDGIPDCSGGEDELACDNFECPGNLRCKLTRMCVGRLEWCDNINQCGIHGDDEHICHGIMCPKGCICKGSVVVCRRNELKAVPPVPVTVKAIILPGNCISLSNPFLIKHIELRFLNLSENCISYVSPKSFWGLENLLGLDLSHNSIVALSVGSFAGLTNLQYLSMQGNQISRLETGFLLGLHSLPVLDMSHLEVEIIDECAFSMAKELKTINLKGNNLLRVKRNAFGGLKYIDLLDMQRSLKHSVYFDPQAFSSVTTIGRLMVDVPRICCIPENVLICQTNGTGPPSCGKLLSNVPVAVTLWIVGIVAFACNLLSMKITLSAFVGCPWMKRQTKKRVRNMQMGIMRLNLAISDIGFAAYLLFLVIADSLYNNTFMRHVNIWEQSMICQFIGALASVSVQMSILTTVLVAVEKCYTVTMGHYYGLIKHHIGVNKIITCILLFWVVCVCLSLTQHIQRAGRVDICMAIFSSVDITPEYRWLGLLFPAINAVACLTLCVSYGKIVHIILTTKSLLDNGSHQWSTFRGMTIVGFVNHVVGIAYSALAFSSFYARDVNLSRQSSLLIVTFVLPLNALLNPLIHNVQYIASRKCWSRKS